MRIEVIVVVCSAFFLLQVGLTVLSVWSLFRDQRSIEARGSSREPREVSAGTNGWLIWIDQAFPAKSGASPGWSRDDAFDWLDDRVGTSQTYQWLQRLGVMAPLVGVQITAFGLRGLDLPSNKSLTISSILSVVTPLFSGVIAGAGLALINQVFLQIVQWRVDQLREAARSWFDKEVWPRANAGPREAVAETVEGLGELARSIRETSRAQRDNARRMRGAARRVARAGLASEKAFQVFGVGLAGLASEVGTLQKVADSIRRFAESMEPSLRQAHDRLTASVDAFGEAVVDRFVPAARNHDEAARFHREASEKTTAILAAMEGLNRQLLEEVGHLTAGARDLEHSGEVLSRSIATSLVPAHVLLLNASGSLDRAAGALPGQFEAATASFASTADQLRRTLNEDLAPAAADFRESIKDDLRPAIERQKAVMGDAASVGKDLTALFEQIQAASKSLEDRYARLAEAANKQSMASEEVHESWKLRLLPAQEQLAGSVLELDRSAAELSRFVKEGLGPATDRLAELGQVIPKIREAAGAIGALGEINTELRDLLAVAQRLREAVDSARSLSELESILGQMSRGFEKADELRKTVSGMPDLFAHQINEMSNRALRRQADDLKETLYDIVKQFAWYAGDANGKAEPHP